MEHFEKVNFNHRITAIKRDNYSVQDWYIYVGIDDVYWMIRILIKGTSKKLHQEHFS